MIKIVKEHNGFHYLLTEIQMYTLILLELNMSQEVLNKIKAKSITQNIFKIQENVWILLYHIHRIYILLRLC